MITFAQYAALLKERPRKFTPAQVGFHRAKKGEPMCAGCMHWFRGAAIDHDVCEIQRPQDEQVPYNWTCTFWTADGDNYPLLQVGGEQSTNRDTINSNDSEGAIDDAH